jgi:hypothetical protein
MGTTDQKIRARKLEKPRNEENAIISHHHWITFAARARMACGISRPSFCAALRFTVRYTFRAVVYGTSAAERPPSIAWASSPGLTADVLAARERQREERSHLRVAVREPEQRDLPAVGEQEHLLDHGLGEDGFVRHDPQRVDAVLE